MATAELLIGTTHRRQPGLRRKIVFASLSAVALLAVSPHALSSSQSRGDAPAQQTPIVLDRVIAVINGDVLLQSDLASELDMAALQPLSLPAGKGLERRAAQRLINRVLILQQMKAQGMAITVSHDDVQKDLDELKKQIPVCRSYRCESSQGWAKFLGDHNLTQDEVDTRWQERMQILRFIDTRFRAGIRISKPEIEDYYTRTFVPQFKAENEKPPPLASVSNRIEEVLLQQHVNLLLADWLKSLRDQGSVVILDPALGINSTGASDEEEGSGR